MLLHIGDKTWFGHAEHKALLESLRHVFEDLTVHAFSTALAQNIFRRVLGGHKQTTEVVSGSLLLLKHVLAFLAVWSEDQHFP